MSIPSGQPEGNLLSLAQWCHSRESRNEDIQIGSADLENSQKSIEFDRGEFCLIIAAIRAVYRLHISRHRCFWRTRTIDVHADTTFAPPPPHRRPHCYSFPRPVAAILLTSASRTRFALPVCSPVSPFRKHAFLVNSALAARRCGRPCSCCAQEGLVQVIPGHAVTVAAPSVQEVMDAIHVRLLLEPEVTRLAAKRISQEQLRSL